MGGCARLVAALFLGWLLTGGASAHDAALAAEPDARRAGHSHVFVTGYALHKVASGTSKRASAMGAGCVEADGWLATDLHLPEGAAIIGVRAYYQGKAEGTHTVDVRLEVTGYPDPGPFITSVLLDETLAATGLNRNHYLALANPETVNGQARTYVLYARTTGDAAVCGLRTFYRLP